MDDELKRILSGESEPEPKPSEEQKPEGEVAQKTNQDDGALKAKQEQLTNLNKAIAQAQDELRTTRKSKKQARVEEDEDIPAINMDDPSAKAWDRHIRQSVAPVQSALEQEREEVRSFALRKFLEDKPALSKSPEKIRELMETYNVLRKASERTVEGVLMDLDRSYGAVFHRELKDMAVNKRIDEAEKDIVFSDIAVSRGATAYQSPKDEPIKLSDEDKEIIRKQGWSVEEWLEARRALK